MKGGPAQTVAQRILERAGYVVHQVHQVRIKKGPHFWVSVSADIWKCIDLAAVNERDFRFVQVCQTSGVSQHRRKIEAVPWPKGEAALFYSVELWEVRSRAFRLHLLQDRTLKEDGWVVYGAASEKEGIVLTFDAPTPLLLFLSKPSNPPPSSEDGPEGDERRG